VVAGDGSRYEPRAMSPMELESVRRASAGTLARAREVVSSCGSAVVAFSAGVDSTFVLAIAREVLGDRAVALTAHSPSVPLSEREDARRLAARLGARHLERESSEQSDPEYVANGQDRCYHCKRELYRLCAEAAREVEAAAVLAGFNADDRRDHRPGHRAAEEASVRSPLAEAELSKAEVRAWSEAYGLATWDKPQMACLASRIPYGTPVTPERLAQVERAEAGLRALGLRDVRVRHHGEIGRVEIGEAELAAAFALRVEVAAAVKAAGFRIAALDLEPFRSGRMNELAGIPLRVL
jgi:pyridinium-3,5-biscarboxylic acid mononucleotide sulfurtransferase